MKGHPLFYYTATGTSMWPYICEGDLLLVQKCQLMSLVRGDVGLFLEADEKVIAHRYLGKGVFKGDRSKIFEPIDSHRFIGKVVAVGKPQEGKCLRFYRLDTWSLRPLHFMQSLLSPLNSGFNLSSSMVSGAMIGTNLVSRVIRISGRTSGRRRWRELV
ncbi:MAG: S24/S26 family peptidase [Bdellovibrionales bacterium]|nr:S24/S26 family peptidase [Bdellovibrionales bacterium]